MKKEELTNNATIRLFDIIQNYECTFIDTKDIFKNLLYLLYDTNIINEHELDSLYNRIDMTTIQELKNIY